MLIREIAKVCHETNKAYCEALNDNSQESWSNAPEWQRESAVNGVKFHMSHPEAGNSASHDNWMKEKLEQGWKYGPVKDPEKKEHHCLVPFDKLPLDQQRKDALFHSIVHALIGQPGEE